MNGLAPDLILHNGKIVTVDRSFAVQEALAVLGDKIVAVGKDSDILALAGDGTQVENLAGSTVLPGQIDNHVHYLLSGLGIEDVRGGKVPIDRAHSIAEILALVKSRVDITPPGEWISTSCMYRGDLEDGRFPNRWDIDQVAPRNPVYIFQSGKNLIVNSEALRLAGIDKETRDPIEPEGTIVRDAAGEPTGHLIAGAADVARSAWWRLGKHLPKKWDFLYYDLETQLEAIRRQQSIFHSCGITGVREMGASADEVQAFVTARRSGLLKTRTDILLGLPTRYWSKDTIRDALDLYFGPPQHIGDEMLWIGGIKLVVVNDGWWAYTPEKIAWLIDELNLRSWTLALHVQTGGTDEATDVVLGALEASDKRRPISGRRFSFEHGLGLVTDDHIHRVKELGMTVSMCSLLAYYGAARSMRMNTVMSEIAISKQSTADGRERAIRDWGLPVRKWLDAGLLVTSGSDVPAVTLSPDEPFLAQYCSLTGDTLIGPLMPGQRVSREQMIKMYTIDAAFASFKENVRGSLERLKLADMTVIDADILTCPDKDVRRLKVLQTYVDGKLVYERG